MRDMLSHKEVQLAIKDTMQELYPDTHADVTAEQRASAKEILCRLLLDRADGVETNMNPVRASMLKTYNKNLHKWILRYSS